MNIKLIVKLLKAGYTPTEIAEVDDPNAVIELIDGGAQKDDIPALLNMISEESTPEAVPEEAPAEAPAEAPKQDYEKMYNALLEKMQKAAARQPSPDAPAESAEDILSAVLRDII